MFRSLSDNSNFPLLKVGKKSKLPIGSIFSVETQSCFLMMNICQRRKINKGHTALSSEAFQESLSEEKEVQYLVLHMLR